MFVSFSDGDDSGDSLLPLGAQVALALWSVLWIPYIATSRVRLYIFYQRAFAAPVLSPLFYPTTSFLGVPLYMTHPNPVPPHQAQPSTAPPYPIQSESSESDPLKMMDLSSSSSSAPDDGFAPADTNSLASCWIDSSLRSLSHSSC